MDIYSPLIHVHRIVINYCILDCPEFNPTAAIIKNNPAILIGIEPVFDEYIVTIKAHEKKFILDPKP